MREIQGINQKMRDRRITLLIPRRNKVPNVNPITAGTQHLRPRRGKAQTGSRIKAEIPVITAQGTVVTMVKAGIAETVAIAVIAVTEGTAGITETAGITGQGTEDGDSIRYWVFGI